MTKAELLFKKRLHTTAAYTPEQLIFLRRTLMLAMVLRNAAHQSAIVKRLVVRGEIIISCLVAVAVTLAITMVTLWVIGMHLAFITEIAFGSLLLISLVPATTLRRVIFLALLYASCCQSKSSIHQ